MSSCLRTCDWQLQLRSIAVQRCQSVEMTSNMAAASAILLFRLQSSALVLQAYPESILDSEELLSHHTQHLNVDPVELIKAGPGARLGQASKELAHEAVVQPLSAVEHHTVHAQSFAQVLQSHHTAWLSHMICLL